LLLGRDVGDDRSTMESAPNIPPGGAPSFPPFCRDEGDWIVLIEFLRDDDPEDRVRATEAIGFMLAYAHMTNTQMLALVGSAEDKVYELLFSFDTPENKAEFLRLLQSNDATRCEDDEILVPQQKEIAAAGPITRVLPIDVLPRVLSIAAMAGNSLNFGVIQ
jgi:hypothetical protein